MRKWQLKSTNTWARLISASVFVIGGAVLVGWVFNIQALKRVLPGLASMKPNAALAFLLTGMTLWLLNAEHTDQSRWHRRLAQIGALAVLLIGVLTLFGVGSAQGRVTPASIISLILLGLALGLLSTSQRYAVSQLSALFLGGIALLALAGYIYDATSLYDSVAIHAIVALLLSSLGILLTSADHGLMAVITGKSLGGTMARRIVPPVVIIPLVLGWLELWSENHGYFTSEFGSALNTFSNIVTISVLVWWTAHLLNRVDANRNRAEERVSQLNRLYVILSDINQAIVRIRQEQTLFDTACQIAVEKGQFRMAWIGVLDLETGRVNVAARAGIVDDYLEKLNIDLKDPSRRDGPTGSSLQLGQHVICNDIEHDPSMAPWREDALRLQYGSSGAFPLKVGGEVRGVFHLYSRQPDFFNDQELRLLDELALDISFALEFAQEEARRQHAEVGIQRYAQRLKILHDIDTGIIGAGTIEELIEGTVKHIRYIIPCQRAGVFMFDHTQKEPSLYAFAVSHPTPLDEEYRIPILPGFFERFDADHVRVIDDYRLIQDQAPIYQRMVNDGLLSALQVLLIDQGQPIGMLSLVTDKLDHFTREHREIIVEVANQLTIAIRQLRLSEALASHAAELEENNHSLRQAEASLQRYAQRMEILHNIDTGIIKATSIQDVVAVALKNLRQLVPCQRADVVLIDEAANDALVFVVDRDGDTALGPGGRVPIPPNFSEGYDANHVRVFDDFRSLQDTMPRARRLVSEGVLCALSVLLMDHEHPMGVLGLFADTPGYFTAEQQEIAAEIANQLAIAVRQLRLSEALASHAAQLEQKVAERTADLTKVKERVEAILNNSTDGILLVKTDLSIQQTNLAFNRLFACGPDDYFRTPLTELVQVEDVDVVTRVLQGVFADQQEQRIEIHARRRDNTGFDAELGIGHIKDDGVVCTIRDITEHKLRERQLRYHAALQANVTDAVISTDLNFRIQSWNKAAERMYGWGAEEVIGQRGAEILQTQFESEQAFEQTIQDFIKEGRWHSEAMQHRKDGTELYVLASTDLLKDESGSPFGIVSVNHDITERKKAENALHQALAKEKELGELKSRFVSMASHEFRTPLATILAATDMLSAYRQKMDDSQIEHRLGKIRDQVGHLRDIMEDVLQLAQIQARRVEFKPVMLDLDSVCRSVMDEFQSQPTLANPLHYYCDDALRQVRLDRKLMRQIISNLVSNAIKYSPTGTPITVSLEYTDATLVLKVQDAGIGIPDTDLKHLFEPFHRAANVGTISGTGLGLSIVKESVELHGGTITVDSVVNIGTTFTVIIPITTEGA